VPGLPGEPLQVKPGAQSAAPVQVPLQAAFAVSQENGAQLVMVTAHWLAALQAEVVSVIPSGQVTGAHEVPTA
jgi:hypothetical protein